jgi:L-fucose isomerase-like protein
MITIKKPKIGLAGVMCTPFRGDKEGSYRDHRDNLEALSQKNGFEFHAVTKGVYSLEDARVAAQELGDWNADFILLQTSSFAAGEFLYPFTDLGTPLGLWAVPEGPPTAEGGLPLNSFTAANMYNSIIKTRLKDRDEPVKWFFGHPDDDLFAKRLAVTVDASRALINLPGKRIASIGGVAPGFDNLIIDEKKLYELLGIEVLHIDLDEVVAIAKKIPAQTALQGAAEIKATATSFDEKHTAELDKSARVYQALEKLAQEREFQAVALSCWPQIQADYGIAVCSTMGHLNSKGLIAACEGDVASAVSMLTLHLMTQGDVVTLMDLVSVDPDNESVLLWHCGPTSPLLADEKGTSMSRLWLFDGPDGERTGLHNDLVLKPGTGTVLGFSVDFERLLILEGEIDNTKPSYMGSRGWLTNLRMNTQPVTTQDLVQTIMASGFQHHYPFGYGAFSEAALELAARMRIKPINVEKYKHFMSA